MLLTLLKVVVNEGGAAACGCELLSCDATEGVAVVVAEVEGVTAVEEATGAVGVAELLPFPVTFTFVAPVLLAGGNRNLPSVRLGVIKEGVCVAFSNGLVLR